MIMAKQRILMVTKTTTNSRTKKNCTCGGGSNGTRKTRSDKGKKRGKYK